ncbi:hypothetical protein AHiyo1_02860 [Arthrobacter sp. Hiyo1]|nr:hypothetical protein AHiyo1_02860 [Arthrobacter sp. Hiyo1]
MRLPSLGLLARSSQNAPAIANNAAVGQPPSSSANGAAITRAETGSHSASPPSFHARTRPHRRVANNGIPTGVAECRTRMAKPAMNAAAD